MDEQRRLLTDQLHDARMGMAERVHSDSGDEIEVALAVKIVDVRALAAAQNQRIPRIVLEKIIALQVHYGLGSGRGFDGCGSHLFIIDEMKTMKAWQVLAWGEPEQMTLADTAIPEPGAGEVRIANRAAALNFFDILQIQGKYQIKPPFPFTPGAEAAGTVDAVGPGVTGLAVGERVLAMTPGGAFAQYSIAPAARAFRMPDGMDFPEAAAMPIVYHTSYFALTRRAALQSGEWLLSHAGASGVGMSAIQIGKALGARIIATAGSRDKLDFCLQQGAEHALDYGQASWVDRVKEITAGRGADVIYDPVGGDVFDL